MARYGLCKTRFTPKNRIGRGTGRKTKRKKRKEKKHNPKKRKKHGRRKHKRRT